MGLPISSTAVPAATLKATDCLRDLVPDFIADKSPPFEFSLSLSSTKAKGFTSTIALTAEDAFCLDEGVTLRLEPDFVTD